jgi:polysaccharide biosynthesis/export protein
MPTMIENKRGFMNIRFTQCQLPCVLVLGSFLVLGPTASAQSPLQARAGDIPDTTSPNRSTSAPTSVPPSDSKYVIGADDELAVEVWQEKELSHVVLVRPDGKISLPLLGELQASGQTPLQIQETITQRLKEYVGQPQVTVIVQQTKSQRFNVVGEVVKPGSYVFGHPVTVLDAIALAGGLRDFAKSKKVYVLRAMADGSQHKLPVNYHDVVKGKKPADNIVLQAHDTVVVP